MYFHTDVFYFLVYLIWIACNDNKDVSFTCSEIGVPRYVRMCRLFYYNSGVSNWVFRAKIYKMRTNETSCTGVLQIQIHVYQLKHKNTGVSGGFTEFFN